MSECMSLPLVLWLVAYCMCVSHSCRLLSVEPWLPAVPLHIPMLSSHSSTLSALRSYMSF
jgi:hypothetical protein